MADPDLDNAEIEPTEEPDDDEETLDIVPQTSPPIELSLPRVFIDPALQRELVRKDPEKFVDLINEIDKRQYEHAKQLEENRNQEELSRQEIAKEEERSRQTTIRLTLFIVLVIVIGGFCYSAFTQDSNLPDKIITALLAVLGGAGGTLALVSRRK